MRVLVTGANGFIGRALANRLLSAGCAGRQVDEIVACDLEVNGLATDARLRPVAGSLAEHDVLLRALDAPVDVAFHLASVPGGAAERDPVLSRRVNLDATAQLVEQLQRQPRRARLVFASTVAVYGDRLPALVDDDTPAQPAMTYGAHKLAAEILIADAARRGGITACSLRLPGVVARPEDGAGLVSAFMSQLFWKLRAGERIVLPVRATGTAWWISIAACVDNLLHAASVEDEATGPRRVVQMPALYASMSAVVEALAGTYGDDRRDLVRFEPQDHVQRLFASYPPLRTARAEALGFHHDGDLDTLARRATEMTTMDLMQG